MTIIFRHTCVSSQTFVLSERSVVNIGKAGREGREKFGSKKATKKRLNQFASTSNKEKRRNKNFMMMRHKQRC
ncbi:Protein SDA1 [Desmophyllum pertusum]|uniref:Protein SDA1 n=1 Tax=Desmophyllum pertusum TaxID=174260 RepID=A0A9X0DAQ2_9CNID|nr:Protein SDA1 [Desmophyllum pertusum]